MNVSQTQLPVLVVSDSAAETTLVQSILEGDFARVLATADLTGAPQLFLDLQAPVLVLACRDLLKAEQFYLGIYRQGAERSFRVHPHRTILLCGKEDVRKAYELCRSGLVDDYVQFWPMTYDAHRLTLSVHRAMQEHTGHPGSSHSAAAFAVQARQLTQLEELLSESLRVGAGHAAAAGQAVNNAQTGIGRAMDGLATHLLLGGTVALTGGTDADDLARQVDRFSENSVQPHLRDVGRNIEPLSSWVQNMGHAMDPHVRSTRVLLEMASQVRHCVLIVDDDQFQQQISGQILDSEGYQVRYAGNGGEALSMLSRMRPDLILMDLLMPDMTGLEVIERIKSEPTLAAIPVIMITGKAERDIVLGSVQLGASDFVVKPVDRQTLLGKVARLLAQQAAGQR